MVLVIWFLTDIDSVYLFYFRTQHFCWWLWTSKFLISYWNTSFFVVVFRNGKTEIYVNIFIKYWHIGAVSASLSLLLFASHRCCWRIGFGALSSKSKSSASRCRRCFFAVGSGVSSCGWIRWLLCLVGSSVLSFLSEAESPQSKLIYPFVPKFQQVVGTNRELFENVLALFSLQQVPILSNRCPLDNGLAGSFAPATELELNRFRVFPF